MASGWSLGPDGDEGSSRGRLVDGRVEGEADILFFDRVVFAILLLKGQASSSSEYLFIPVFFYSMDRLYTPGVPKENLLVLVLVMEARSAGKSDVGEQ